MRQKWGPRLPDGHGAAPQQAVVPRACGVSSTPRLLESVTNGSGILDHPLSRMMTAESAEISNRQTHLHIPAARSVRVGAENIRPKQRAWGMPGARCTRSRAWCVVNTRVSHHGYTGSPGIPARNGFNGFLRALLGDRALLSPSLTRIAPQSLTPASGRQDHTTSSSASACPRQKRRLRPSHPSPRP